MSPCLVFVHVGVGQRCRAPARKPMPSLATRTFDTCDVKSPALPTMSTHNVPAGRWRKYLGKAESEHTSAALLEYTLVLVSVAVPPMQSPPPCKPKTEHVTFHPGDGGNAAEGSNASTYILRRQNHEHVHDSRSEFRVQSSEFIIRSDQG